MKKLLAFVLCAIMLLGMIPMAGAASFKDTDKITIMNTEAVDVMSDLKIITGFPEGTFKPDDTLTRAQAAKILCCVALGSKAADELPAGGSTFADVPASHWANKYVEYCASKGIVAGVGNGKFNPDGKLTGYAFGKMLLVALGADASALTGADWDKNTKAQLAEKHLDYGVSPSNNDLSRQDACRLALNTLFYGEKDDAESTLAFKSFGVLRSSSGSDKKYYNRPVIKYVSSDDGAYWEGTEKKITASPVFFKKSGAVKGGDLVKVFGVTDIEGAQIVSIRNGVTGKPLKTTVLHEGNTKTHTLTGNGMRFEAYYAADTDKYTFVHLYYFAVKIADVTEAAFYSDGSVEVEGSVTFENGQTVKSNEFKKSDIGSYACVYSTGKGTMAKLGTITEAFHGTVVKGKLTKYAMNKSLSKCKLEIDGKSYKFPGWMSTDSLLTKYVDNGGAVGDEVNLLLTPDGYALEIWQ